MSKSQAYQILADLRKGRKITALDALTNYGCLRLGARIEELRKAGHKIITERITTKTGKHVARYELAK
jgi:hypothetical protein